MTVYIRPLQHDYQWKWLHERAKPELTPRSKGIVAQRSDGTILAAAVFDSWTESSAQVHVAIENPIAIRHGFVHECMDYFFNFCDRKVLIGLTPENNERALKFNKKLGFEELFRVPDAYEEGIAFVVQQLRKENCRWINHGKRHTRAA